MQFFVRPAAPGDLERCEELEHTYSTKRVWQLTVERQALPASEEAALSIFLQPSRLPRPLVLQLPPLEAPLTLAAERYDSFVVLVQADSDAGEEQICGFAAVHVQPGRPVAELSLLFVAPPFRRQGGGTLLLQWALGWARMCGLDGLVAHAPTRGEPAICFYQRHGFHICGYSEYFYSNQDIALFFARQ